MRSGGFSRHHSSPPNTDERTPPSITPLFLTLGFSVVVRDRRTEVPSQAGVGLGSGSVSNGFFCLGYIPHELKRRNQGLTVGGVCREQDRKQESAIHRHQ